MSILEAVLMSVGLAMDAFAVSICTGLELKNIKFKDAIKVGLWFGVFQALMPLIGYLLGSRFESLITNIDHWVAFVLLVFIGGKMIYEAFHEEEGSYGDLKFKSMLVLAIATSIDALAIGIAYAFLYGSKNMVLSFSLIGVITFIISVIGVKIGNVFGNKFKNIAEIVGGVILILIGTKILFEHLGVF